MCRKTILLSVKLTLCLITTTTTTVVYFSAKQNNIWPNNWNIWPNRALTPSSTGWWTGRKVLCLQKQLVSAQHFKPNVTLFLQVLQIACFVSNHQTSSWRTINHSEIHMNTHTQSPYKSLSDPSEGVYFARLEKKSRSEQTGTSWNQFAWGTVLSCHCFRAAVMSSNTMQTQQVQFLERAVIWSKIKHFDLVTIVPIFV